MMTTQHPRTAPLMPRAVRYRPPHDPTLPAPTILDARLEHQHCARLIDQIDQQFQRNSDTDDLAWARRADTVRRLAYARIAYLDDYLAAITASVPAPVVRVITPTPDPRDHAVVTSAIAYIAACEVGDGSAEDRWFDNLTHAVRALSGSEAR